VLKKIKSSLYSLNTLDKFMYCALPLYLFNHSLLNAQTLFLTAQFLGLCHGRQRGRDG